MKNHLILLIILISFLTSKCSCSRRVFSSAKTINNYATSTDKMFDLTPGMSLDEVKKTLDCVPTDFYSNIRNDQKILVFKYRKNYQSFLPAVPRYLSSLREGNSVYSDESDLYVIFDSETNNMLYYITQSGRNTAFKEILLANKLKLKK